MTNAQIVLVLAAAVAPVSTFLVLRSIPLPSARIVNRSLPSIPRIGVVVWAVHPARLALSFAGRWPIPREIERIALICIAGSAIVLLKLATMPRGWLRRQAHQQFGVAAILVLPRLRGHYHGIAIDRFNAPGFGQIELALPLAIGATLIWLVATMNAINWIDGIDGLAPTVTLVASVILFLHTYFWPRTDPQFTISILPLVLGAALLGFLPFNWFPARITLGDAGANFLGLTIAAIAIVGGAKLATALLVLGLPLLDLFWVTTARALRGQPVATGDTSHLHHRLLARGWGVGRIVAFVGGVSLFFGVLSLLLPSKEAKLGALVSLAVVLLLTVGRPGRRGFPR